MKQQTYILIVLLFVTTSSFGQKATSPHNIDEAIQILFVSVSDSMIEKSKNQSQSAFLALCEDWNSEYNSVIRSWIYHSDKRSKIEKYYSKFGINYTGHIEKIILIAFYRKLHDDKIEHEELIKKYAAIENEWDAEDKVRFTTDSLRGIYIPKDLEDCFKQIDSFWSDSTKTQVKNWSESEFSAKSHFGLGLWMRNNWQLWGGSRLSKYFNDLGIYHPDDMSGIILISYHRYLSGEEIKLEDQIKFYQDYWKKSSEQNKKK